MEEIMIYKKNPLNGSYLCWIPGTAQGYYYSSKKMAKKFCDEVNKAFAAGRLKLEDGKVTTI
jgi:hypothetical protein